MRNIVLTAFFTLIFSTTLFASDMLEVKGAWVRESPPGMKMAAGYMSLVNRSSDDILLTGITSPQFGFVEMHLTEIDGENARMVRQESVTVKAGETFVFAPRSYHLMLMEPVKQLKEGDTVEFHLSFESGETFMFSSPVRKDTGSGMHHGN